MVKQISDNEIYLLIKYIKSVLWRVAKRLSYTEDAWCLKVKYEESLCSFGSEPLTLPSPIYKPTVLKILTWSCTREK